MKGSEVMAKFFFALGTIHLSTYLKTYKVGDIVDIKVGLFILHVSILTQGARKSVLQPVIGASFSYHVLALKSFQLAPKPFLISRIDYNPSVIWISPQNSTFPSCKLKTKITSPIAKSTSPRLLETTFFARYWNSQRT